MGVDEGVDVGALGLVGVGGGAMKANFSRLLEPFRKDAADGFAEDPFLGIALDPVVGLALGRGLGEGGGREGADAIPSSWPCRRGRRPKLRNLSFEHGLASKVY